MGFAGAVSYTHLDVYKRQLRHVLEKGQWSQSLTKTNVMVVLIRKKEGRWEISLTNPQHSKQNEVTLYGCGRKVPLWLSSGENAFQIKMREFLRRTYQPGAMVIRRATYDQHTLTDTYLYVLFEPGKEASLRWF